jgi:hypothetical protein
MAITTLDLSKWQVDDTGHISPLNTLIRVRVEEAVFYQGHATQNGDQLYVEDAIADIVFAPLDGNNPLPNKESNMTENNSELISALLKAQGEFPPIPMDSENKFYQGHKYASLQSILKTVIPVLNQNGLLLTHKTNTDIISMPVEQNGNIVFAPDQTGSQTPILAQSEKRIKVTVTCVLIHTSGQAMETSAGVVVEGKNIIQSIGIAITYLRRYTTSALLGLFTETDDDGNHFGSNKTTAKKSNAKKKPAVQFNKAAIDAVMEAGGYKAVNHANAILNLSQKLPEDIDAETAVIWHNVYRNHRGEGLEPPAAAKKADEHYLSVAESKYDELID